MAIETLTHGMNCGGYPGSDDECTCGLEWRIKLQTEQTMHRAWRKRAEESEAEAQAAGKLLAERDAEIGRLRQAAREFRSELRYSHSILRYTVAATFVNKFDAALTQEERGA